MNNKLPELLAPAGSPRALLAAVEAGADAVYFGGEAFNARLRADNFDADAMREGIKTCHTYGVKTYVTLNTLFFDREERAFLAAAESAYLAGADALIVADLGGAALLRRHLPDLPLHASTQCSAHDLAGVRALAEMGFCRVVPARELPRDEIARLVREGGVEIEVFVHGALCVSFSGQCLFSSLVGGRSGNRGECAGPCRLPDARGNYPLSLKDLSLARHVPELTAMGVHSLKIEGRQKSAEYVRDVVAVYRRLLDEGRGATDEEMRALAAAFSRSGFTDGYFCRRVDHRMLGVRTEEEKAQKTIPFTGISRKIPLFLSFSMRAGEPLSLSLTANGKTVTVKGAPPDAAKTAPMNADAVAKNLCRFGNTPFFPAKTEFSVEPGLMAPVSELNALRRAAVAALTSEKARELPEKSESEAPAPRGEKSAYRSARFENVAQITPRARSFFDLVYLPLESFAPAADGVVLPPVTFDGERGAVRSLLREAVERGARHALIGNLGHLDLAAEAGLLPHGDFRLNVTNARTLSVLLDAGFADVLLSPELSLPQIRDLSGACDAIVYGRVPLMILEKCAGREVGDCSACARGENALVDRRGERFPILRAFSHRNTVYNSRPTVMSDKKNELFRAGLRGGHFLFSTETAREVDLVIDRYTRGAPMDGEKRRI